MQRRLFLTGGALASLGLGASVLGMSSPRFGPFVDSTPFPAALRYPGMDAGHSFRDMLSLSTSKLSQLPVFGTKKVVIIGSGIAGLSCAWQLNQGGAQDFLLLDGPAPLGNAAFGQHQFGAYPQGAHYLPVPSVDCMHVRHILKDLGVLVEGVAAEAPRYDERYLVHASAERVFHEGRWHHGVLPEFAIGSPEHLQWVAVQAKFRQFSQMVDAQGDRVFRKPIVLSGASAEAEVRDLDRVTFAAWLLSTGVTHPLLKWYFDYCCRDEYGADASLVSAWAGVHYFCTQPGLAQHADANTQLTWPNGLGFLAEGLRSRIRPEQRLAGMALRIEQAARGQSQVLVRNVHGELGVVLAKNVVVATPLFVARRLAPHAFADLETQAGLSSSPWMVANFFMERFPQEKPGEQLSWDNVISGSESLGYVVSTHQRIRAAKPQGTVFSTYHALGSSDNRKTRKHLLRASAAELLAQARRDLDTAYDDRWSPWCTGVEITIHGHGMAVPSPGFRSDPIVHRAQGINENAQGLMFAHSDLSGYSVFEEASYWGTSCAHKLLAQAGA